jgi:hypothetical protein
VLKFLQLKFWQRWSNSVGSSAEPRMQRSKLQKSKLPKTKLPKTKLPKTKLQQSQHWAWSGLLVSTLLASALIGIGLAQSSFAQTGGEAVTVRVNRWLEVQQMTAPVTYFNRSTNRTARLGDRLQAVGDGLVTGDRGTATLEVDTEIGIVEVAADTRLQVTSLESTASGGRITKLRVDQGRVRLQVRPLPIPTLRSRSKRQRASAAFAAPNLASPSFQMAKWA